MADSAPPARTVPTIDGKPVSERVSVEVEPLPCAWAMPAAEASATRLTTERWATTLVGRWLSVKRR